MRCKNRRMAKQLAKREVKILRNYYFDTEEPIGYVKFNKSYLVMKYHAIECIISWNKTKKVREKCTECGRIKRRKNE